MNLTLNISASSQWNTLLARGDTTQHEIAALRTGYNLADAHTHQDREEIWDDSADVNPPTQTMPSAPLPHVSSTH